MAESDAKVRRFRPSLKFLWLWALLLVPAAISIPLFQKVAVYGPLTEQGGFGVLVAATLAALIDLLISRSPPPLDIRRLVPANLALNRQARVRLLLQTEERGRRVLEIFDHLPDSVLFTGLPVRIRLQAGQILTREYAIRPIRRGDIRFAGVEVRFRSRLGLWDQQHRYPVVTQARVFPDFVTFAGGRLSGVMNRTGYPGIRVQQRRGEGTEFHQLRDYRQGDLVRQIDWKATSRRIKLVAREYQQERDQNLILLLDCGNRMNTWGDELSDFDHALNAALCLAQVALRQGDSVGMQTFGEHSRWLPPVKGAGRIGSLMSYFYDLYPGPGASDYIQAAEILLARQRKRSLVVLITNLRDEDSGDLRQFVELVGRRHLVLVASLREPLVDEILDGPVANFEQAVTLGSAAGFAIQRRKVEEQLRARGVMLAEAAPSALGPRLISHYLDIKRRRSL